MDRNPDSPWNPRIPVDMSPREFEKLALEWLTACAKKQNHKLKTKHLGIVQGMGGEYKIDVLVEFTFLGGASIFVLVECKHQSRPVEREDIMVLEAKLRDVSAHKGIVFSTSGFQSGAIKYAAAYRIATVTVVRGAWLYETKAAQSKPAEPPPWVQIQPFAGIRVSPGDKGISCHTLDMTRLDALLEWFTTED